ncbi:MAG TPA: cell wall-binding repeat-containing protein [Candidatus Sulfotelmatobacter sp.]|nr:cell wall-binding repeat-containing protein [Candidatus Sulfotelmatobacter sp.]
MPARRSPFRQRLIASAMVLAIASAMLAGVAGPAAAPALAATPVTPPDPGLFATGSTSAEPRTVSPDATTTAADGFVDTAVFTGLDHPTVVRFAANGVVFVAEKGGQIVDYTSVASDTPHLFADLSAEVDDYWDRGLLGMALAPDFPSDPSVYVMYTYDHDPVHDLGNPDWDAPAQWNDACPGTQVLDPPAPPYYTGPGSTTDGCPAQGRIARLTAASDGNGGYVSTGPETVLLTDDCQQFPSHSVGNLAFGPDGYLYASMGEGSSFLNPGAGGEDYGQYGGTQADQAGHVYTPANPCGDPTTAVGTAPSAPTAEGGALRAQSVRRTDGPTVLNGTLMRLQTNGAGAPGNPYAASPDANAKRILAYGFRNPFRFAFKPGSTDVWVGDVGYNSWEEVDRVSVPDTKTTANYGWPCVEGNQQDTYYTDTTLDLCSPQPTSVAPYTVYNHGACVPSGSACHTTSPSPPGPCDWQDGSVISAVAFYEGATYPSAFHGALFFGDHSRDCIWAMQPGANGLPDPTKIVTVLSGAAGANCIACPVDLEAGPNGDMFYVDHDGGRIDEISYGVPEAVISSDVTYGAAPLTVHFDGSGSETSAPPLTYSWDLDGDGTFGDSTSATPTKVYADGTYHVRLRVTDANGVSNTSAPLTIAAGDTPPTASITLIDGSPPPAQPTLDTNGDPPPIQPAGVPPFYSVGQDISFAGSASDNEQGTLPAAALSWDVHIYHCPQAGCHTHELQSFAGVASGHFSAPQHDYPSLLEITLTATDDHDLQDTTTVYLYPKAHTVTLQSDPTGLTLSGGDVSAPAPFVDTFIEGSTISLVAPPLQTSGPTQYGFVAWSDGGAASHSVVVPSGDTTYTARYIPDARLAGPDRYGTSAAAAAQYPAPQAVVYVASGTEFPDAAAAAALAGQQHAPLLLVQPTAIPAAISTQLTRLAPARIVVLGSSGAVSEAVFNQLKAFTTPAAGQVSRAAGPDRYATAAGLAEAVFPGHVDTVVVANGLNFPDAVSAAPLAALLGAPVLYVQPTAIPSFVRDALVDVLTPTHIVIVGGVSAVSAAVATDLGEIAGSTPIRYGGADRYATAELIAAQVAGGSHPSAVYVASGVNYPDAITGASLAASLGDPVLLAMPSTPLPASTAAGMAAMKPDAVVVMGGSGALSDAVLVALPAASAP